MATPSHPQAGRELQPHVWGWPPSWPSTQHIPSSMLTDPSASQGPCLLPQVRGPAAGTMPAIDPHEQACGRESEFGPSGPKP